MVWIHGGGHRVGASSFPIYNGEAFARQGVILVSINYRLGLLGYFAHPALTRAAGSEPVGNYGFMDQIAALQWVQRNIAAFGGDPHNVTAFGESAGGASLVFLLTSPAANGLFQRAIVESGGGTQNPANLATEEAAGVTASGRIGLGPNATVEEMRARPVEDWLRALGPLQGLGFGPFIDGRLITEAPPAAFAAGRGMDVPLMIGSNSNEASVMTALGVRVTAAQFAGPMLPQMRAAYGNVSDEEMTRQALGDVTFGYGARFVAAREAAGAPSYLYHFSYVPVVRQGRAPGAGHGSEIPFVFQSWNQMPVLARFVQPQDERMARLMSACWVSFARTGAPTCPGAEPWPAYSPRSDMLMEFGVDGVGVRTHFRQAQYDFITARLGSLGTGR
jgi:para-nitrobenzyl esterase